MNKKGFTLVELLAVIIILSLLTVLASASVTKVVTNSKSELYDTQIELIKAAAQTWGADNLNKLPSENDECKYLNLGELKKYGLLDSSIINPKTNKEFSDNMNIKITSILTDYGNLNFKYEVDAIDVSSCTPVYEKICALVNDVDNSGSITPGDKYQCKVKDNMEEGFEDGYYFFVLSHNDDGTTNLIMERNMYYDEDSDIGVVATSSNSNVAWYASTGDHSFGPVTAMTYLHNATKDWNNIPNMIMNYEDENIDYTTQQKGTNGYGSIVTTGTTTIITSKNDEETGRIENLKARMPRYDEVHGEGKCLTYKENGNNYGSCPLWLSNYLSNSQYVTGEGLQNISGIYGYWTLASNDGDYTYAWYVSYDGHVDSFSGVYYGNDYGVRPVITIPKYNLSNKVK